LQENKLTKFNRHGKTTVQFTTGIQNSYLIQQWIIASTNRWITHFTGNVTSYINCTVKQVMTLSNLDDKLQTSHTYIIPVSVQRN